MESDNLKHEFHILFYDGIHPCAQPGIIRFWKYDAEISLTESGKIIKTKNINLKPDESFAGKRRIYLNDTEYFLDDGSVTNFLRSLSQKNTIKIQLLIEKIESNWPLVFCSFLLLIFSGWLFVNQGVPYVSIKLAALIPEKIAIAMGQQALNGLDQINILESSRISEADQLRIREKYRNLCLQDLSIQSCRIEFRHSKHEALNYNAFAVPGGLTVLLDGIYEIAKDDNEIISILLHELGHHKHNHSLQKLVEGSVYTIALALALGDVSSISSLATSAPAAIVQAQYSQKHEVEADDWALSRLQKNNISTKHFANIMQRLGDKFELCEESVCKDEEYSLINSHPGITSRINKARLISSESEKPTE